MDEITKEAVFRVLNSRKTLRKQFSHHSGIQKSKESPTFSVPFDCGLVAHVLHGTGRTLTYNSKFDQHYCFLRDDAAIKEVEAWEAAQNTRVFIRNMLTSTVALDVNFVDNTSGAKTQLGELEERAKHSACGASIEALVARSAQTIAEINALACADFVVAVPAMEDKTFDLPRVLASKIATLVGKEDLTPRFRLKDKAGSLKSATLEDKWDIWANSDLTAEGLDLTGKSVILVDDKYQSGVTLQFFGSFLQRLGCNAIHGLCMVKTLRDTDNVQLTEA